MPNTAVTLKGNARVCAWATNGTFELGGLSGAKGTYLMGSSKNTKNFECTWQVGMANTDEQFDGIINNWDCSGADRGGTVSIEKRGTGDWRLTGQNPYKGTTVVSAGRLIVNGTNSGTGAVTVKSGATLSGTGSLAGRVTVNNGGTVHAGDTLTNIKTLTLNGGLNVQQGGVVEIPLTTAGNFARCNKLKVVGTMNISNAVMSLDISEAAQIADDKSFTVFDLTNATVSGTGFARIEPERPSPTQVWDTSQLLTTGRLFVRSAEDVGVVDILNSEPHSPSAFNLMGMPVNTRSAAPGLVITADGKKIIQKR